VPPAAARDAALRAFGGVEPRKEECRDARRVAWIEDFGKDLVYSGRMARRAPAFTAAALLSVAIGVGASSAIFSLFDELLLRPLPVVRPHELRVVMQEVVLGGRTVKSGGGMGFEWFRDVPASTSLFSEVLGFADIRDVTLTVEAQEIRASRRPSVASCKRPTPRPHQFPSF
jgi:hypothetical protein